MTDVVKVASEIFNALGQDTINRLQTKPFTGEVIESASLEANIGTKEIKNNCIFIKPCLKMWPDRVCSGYLYADILLFLDVLLNGNLFVPRGSDTKRNMALAAAGRLKKIVAWWLSEWEQQVFFC
jgi:hypothetical protein